MAYYTGEELDQDLKQTVKELNRQFTDDFTYDFFLDARSGLAEIYIENELILIDDPEDVKDVIYDNIGSILECFITELGMGEYSFQVIVEYNQL